ncbi:M24 family metallopeptidase [Proteus mirabilis]|nr:M24 family metallopeptidase [Proteus mirabilis]
MAIVIKTEEDIQKMRVAGRLAAEVLEVVAPYVKPGVSTADDGGVVLQKGMAFTIEPMVNTGDYRIRTMKDGWTVKTKDRGWSAQYEHTLVVTDNGCEIMTLRKEEEPFISAVLVNE